MIQLSDSLRSALQARRLVFTVTTGRSGTEFLTKLLRRRVRGLSSLHEPKPSFVDVMRDAQTQPELAARFLVERKLPVIAADPSPVYLETSHLFCKGFAEPLYALGLRPDLILLSREPRLVAASLFRVNTIPGRTDDGLRWYLSPDDPGVLPLADWRQLPDYCLCYWYCLEIERRQQAYARLAQRHGAAAMWITLDELNSYRGFDRVHRFVTHRRPLLRVWWRFRRRRGKPVNEKARRKNRMKRQLPADLDALEAMVRERVVAAPAAPEPALR